MRLGRFGVEGEVSIIVLEGGEDRTEGGVPKPIGDELDARLKQRVTTSVMARTDRAKGVEGKCE